METLYFMLGVLTVLAVVNVVGLVSVWKKASSNADETGSVWTGIDSINRDLGTEIKNVQNEIEERVNFLDRDLNEQITEIHRIIDSRLDKLEDRLTKMYNEGCKPAKEK